LEGHLQVISSRQDHADSAATWNLMLIHLLFMKKKVKET
jgi:hypothetical protein